MSEAVVRPFPLKSPLRVLSSLRLTVVCLGLGMLLVFLGTLAQVNLGIHAVQARYFQSLFIFWSPPGASWKIPVLPGGYLLGTVLLVNLIAAHAVRFQLTRKKLGIILLHFGVILLLIGQLLTGLFARETQMRIDEGQTLGYSEAPREVELAVIDKTDPNFDQVVAIPEDGAGARRHNSESGASVYAQDPAIHGQRASRDAFAGTAGCRRQLPRRALERKSSLRKVRGQ